MTERAHELLRAVLGLPEEDRVRIATEVLASLDGPPVADWAGAWGAELVRTTPSLPPPPGEHRRVWLVRRLPRCTRPSS